jgi:hypothetical protein
MTEPPVVVKKAVLADPEDDFALQWGRETLKDTIPRLDAALQRLITLDTALLGGSIFFVSSDILPHGFRLSAMFAFLASLAVAFYGSQLVGQNLALGDPDAIRSMKAQITTHRYGWLRWASWLLWTGLFFATLGSLFRVVSLT